MGRPEKGGNISTFSDDAGKTRDIAAAKAGLGSGKTLEAAQKVVERDENDQRKEPTVSEKVALAEAIAERLGERQGQRTDLGTSGNISLSEAGQTRDIAAAKAGLGSGPSAASCASPHGPGSGEGGSTGDWRKTAPIARHHHQTGTAAHRLPASAKRPQGPARARQG